MLSKCVNPSSTIPNYHSARTHFSECNMTLAAESWHVTRPVGKETGNKAGSNRKSVRFWQDINLFLGHTLLVDCCLCLTDKCWSPRFRALIVLVGVSQTSRGRAQLTASSGGTHRAVRLKAVKRRKTWLRKADSKKRETVKKKQLNEHETDTEDCMSSCLFRLLLEHFDRQTFTLQSLKNTRL